MKERRTPKTPHGRMMDHLRTMSPEQAYARVKDPAVRAELAQVLARRAKTGQPSAAIATQTTITGG